jgi:hypothetical protein
MLDNEELAALERDVDAAMAAGGSGALRVLGRGEISLVLGWPPDAPRWACKRLPPFPHPAAADAYEAAVRRYLEMLSARGVDVVDTSLHRVPAHIDHGDAVVLYCIQAVLADHELAPAVVRAGGARAEELVRAIVDRSAAVVDRQVGLDAQLSNWALVDGRLRYFDVTTPLLRDAAGLPAFDADVFLASVPWVLRSPIRRFVVPGIIERYHDTRTVLSDLAANLLKERLEAWIPVVLDAAARHVDRPLTEAQVRADYRSDARTWAALQAVRRVDRAWQRRVRRRPYPFLLPDRIER